MHILIAPNAFKNSLSAAGAAEAISEGLLQSGLPCSVQCFPIGDGGDGTASLIVKNQNGVFQQVFAKDPLGRKIKTTIGFIDEGKTAVIEMADISGLKLLHHQELDVLHASSFGTGELIRFAMNQGVCKIILGIGGSATVDGGSGALQALGVHFLDRTGKELMDLAENLVHLDTIDLSGLDKRIFDTELVLLCDVNNRLLGKNGAAAVFGPQKGASQTDVIILEKALKKFRKVSFQQTGEDMNTLYHGGAAGGTSAGLKVFLKAKLMQGIDYFLDLTRFDEALEKTDLLITAEGSIDIQTLEGKGPFGVARRAKKKNIPVIGLAGKIPQESNLKLNRYFDVLLAIGDSSDDLKTAMQHTAENLRQTARQLGKLVSIWT